MPQAAAGNRGLAVGSLVVAVRKIVAPAAGHTAAAAVRRLAALGHTAAAAVRTAAVDRKVAVFRCRAAAPAPVVDHTPAVVAHKTVVLENRKVGEVERGPDLARVLRFELGILLVFAPAPDLDSDVSLHLT